MPLPLHDAEIPRAAAGASAAAVVEPLQFDQRHVSDSPEEAGAEELPPEEEFFYDTQEFNDMEDAYRKFYNICDSMSGTEGCIDTIGDLVASLRALANELEGLREGGWEMAPEETLEDGGCEFALTNPRLEREQWRQRRQRRRAALAADRQRQQAAEEPVLMSLPPQPPVPDSMDTDDAEAQAAEAQGAVVAGAAAKGPGWLKSPQRGSPAFCLF